ncbi:MAG: autotransporter assembly complex protein TamA, partial [Polymorphobacter sp.]
MALLPGAALVAAPLPGPQAVVPDIASGQESPLFNSLAPLPDDAVAWPTLESTEGPDIVVEASEADVRYSVSVNGLADLDLVPRFNELSQLYKGRGEPSNIAQIRRRTITDTNLIDQLLRSVGHFGATITPEIVAPLRQGDFTLVSFNVEPGPLYHFARIDIIAPDPAAAAIATKALGLVVGAAAAAAPFDAAQSGLRPTLANLGYPFPEIEEPAIVIDHATQAALLTQAIDPGPLGRFGAVRSEGDAQITARHMERMTRFKTGDTFSAAEVEDLRRALIATNLYGSVVIRPVEAGTNPDGTAIVDLVVTGETAPLRTISASAGYSTGEGIRAAASWQHRNLFPPQGAVTFNGVAAQREQALGAEFRRRNWLKRDRTLVVAALAAAEEQDAYEATTATISGLIERETNLIWQKKWYYSIGLEFAASNEADLSEATGPDAPRTLYYIVSAPLSLSFDGSNDLLNPERGFRLNFRVAPQVSFQTGSFAYVRAQVEGSYYLP